MNRSVPAQREVEHGNPGLIANRLANNDATAIILSIFIKDLECFGKSSLATVEVRVRS